jgi:L,D-peptidoglycan transpeptidase YkuD (ErfK/YbiS/YcfS/YnhG family)
VAQANARIDHRFDSLLHFPQMRQTSWSRAVAVPVGVLTLGLILAACGSGGGPTSSEKAALAGNLDATSTVSAPPTTAPRVTTTDPPTPCPQYSSAVYGIDPDDVALTGGGSQLITVVAPTSQSVTGTFVAWADGADGCWSPVVFAGQPAQPYQAETGHGGLIPISQRVPGDWATPTGLFSFGNTIYGNSTVSPTTLYPYHHLVCGDWWDEEPGSPTYDALEHVLCGTTPTYAADSEALWTEVQPYQHFIDIPMPNPPDNGAGIFLHDDMAVGYTEGCVALPNAELDAALAWLNPADNPHILITVG